MDIRKAEKNDLPRLLDLWEERQVLLQQAHPRFADNTQTRDMIQSLLLQYVDDPTYALFVADDAGDLAGFIAGELASGSIGKIHMMALDAHQYHAGVGRKLYTALRAVFEASGVERIMVKVPRYHAVEQAFWRALGGEAFIVTEEMDEEQWKIPRGFMWMML